jgi:glycosyltransferase involved in cell wall biosynthesis
MCRCVDEDLRLLGASVTARLGIVIPCFNESSAIEETKKRVLEDIETLVQAGKISSDSFVCFVDDGSQDDTWEKIEAFCLSSDRVNAIKLSRNYGHQTALWAGYSSVVETVDCCISMDADLQDDPEIISEFVDKWREGYEIVYGVRNDRRTDTAFKRGTAGLFYRIMKLMGCDIIPNHADFRLLSQKALTSLLEFGEANLFIRGLVPMVGLRSTRVFYERHERHSGTTKYSLKKMIGFAFDGITSFSVAPLRMVWTVGAIVFVLSTALGMWAFLGWVRGDIVPGWASTVLPIYFLGGIQILFIGLIGEYLGKIYKEVKRRPKYFIEQQLTKANESRRIRQTR